MRPDRLLLALLLPLLAIAPLAWTAETGPWQAITEQADLHRQLEQRAREQAGVVALLKETMPDSASPELAAARQALAAAEAAAVAAHSAAGLDGLRERRNAAMAARDAAIEQVLATAPAYQTACQRAAVLVERIAALEARLSSADIAELTELAALREEERHLGRRLYDARKARWQHPAVDALFEAAGALYGQYKKQAGDNAALEEAQQAVKAARKALASVLEGLTPPGAEAVALIAELAATEAARDAAKLQLNELRQAQLAGATTVSIPYELPPKKGKPQKPATITLWIPPHCQQIRGVVAAAPQFSKFATHPAILEAAVREQLATMVFHGISFDGAASLVALDGILGRLAEKSGHPELVGAAVLTAGLSASVIQARNLAYVAPQRVFGVVQVAGGNMHHHVPPDTSLSGVPFIAMNGELEWCGPEGGLRPEYGRQTQWLMLREQLLRRRRSDPQHLMSLLVVPGADHGAWDSDIAALFVRKAARYRLAPTAGDASVVEKCVPVEAEDGWLTDARLDQPRHPPAPWADYAGAKDEAFWVFDEELARALTAYHDGRFLLPDPTGEFPVPADWPPQKR